MRKESTECSFSRSSWGKEPALNPINLAAQRSSWDFNESDREDQLAQRRHQTPEEWSVHWCCGRCQPLDVPTRYFLLLFKKFTPPPGVVEAPFSTPPPRGVLKHTPLHHISVLGPLNGHFQGIDQLQRPTQPPFGSAPNFYTEPKKQNNIYQTLNVKYWICLKEACLKSVVFKIYVHTVGNLFFWTLFCFY